jgi:adenosylcobinamide-GDP ribazoletransferase
LYLALFKASVYTLPQVNLRFLLALRFLTIVPLPWPREADARAVGRSLVFFPLVGLLLGLFLAGLDRVLALLLPPAVTSALLLAALVVLTGALHLDGFIDTCDGLASRGSPLDKRAAMRDSRVGALGVVGALSLILIKYASLISLPDGSRIISLVLMPLLGRWAMVYAVFRCRYASPDGVGKVFKENASGPGLAVATLIAVVPALAFLQLQGLAVLLGTWLLVWLWAGLLNRKFNGLTGDNYGATNEVVEVATLVLLLLFSSIKVFWQPIPLTPFP